MPSSISQQCAYLFWPGHAETFDVLGPTIQFVTSPNETNAPCVIRGTIPPGVSIPLHSHEDPETFVLLSGTVEALVCRDENFEWMRIVPGEVFHVPPHAKHAWRNNGEATAAMIIVTTSRLGRFLAEIGKPSSRQGISTAAPSPDEIQRFLQTSERYGYWNATPDENARVGIIVRPDIDP
jgi:quercetin dioxygenase-like cupin family protein